jgi:hypothetical protein
MDPEADEKHFSIAQESLQAELPEPWQQGISEEGDPYHFNEETGESMWEHPMDEFYRQKFAKAKAADANKVSDAEAEYKKAKEDQRQQEQRQQEQRQQAEKQKASQKDDLVEEDLDDADEDFKFRYHQSLFIHRLD